MPDCCLLIFRRRYYLLLRTALAVFACSAGPDGVHLLDADPSIVCWSTASVHSALVPAAIACVGVLGAGVPAALYGALWRHRRAIARDQELSIAAVGRTGDGVGDANPVAATASVRARYGALYADFRVKSPAWRVTLLARKAAVTTAVLLAAGNTGLQAGLVMAILAHGAGATAQAWPYIAPAPTPEALMRAASGRGFSRSRVVAAVRASTVELDVNALEVGAAWATAGIVLAGALFGSGVPGTGSGAGASPLTVVCVGGVLGVVAAGAVALGRGVCLSAARAAAGGDDGGALRAGATPGGGGGGAAASGTPAKGPPRTLRVAAPKQGQPPPLPQGDAGRGVAQGSQGMLVNPMLRAAAATGAGPNAGTALLDPSSRTASLLARSFQRPDGAAGRGSLAAGAPARDSPGPVGGSSSSGGGDGGMHNRMGGSSSSGGGVPVQQQLPLARALSGRALSSPSTAAAAAGGGGTAALAALTRGVAMRRPTPLAGGGGGGGEHKADFSAPEGAVSAARPMPEEARVLEQVGRLLSSSVAVQEAAAGALASRDYADGTASTTAAAAAVPRLIALLGSMSVGVRRAAAAALAALCAGGAELREQVARAGGVPPLVRVLRSGVTAVQEGAAAALGALASDPGAAGAMLAAGALPPLVAFLRAPSAPLCRSAVTAIAALVAPPAGDDRGDGGDRGDGAVARSARAAVLDAGGVPTLVALLGRSGGDEALSAKILGALGGLAGAAREAVVRAGALPLIVGCLRLESPALAEAAGGALAALLAAGDGDDGDVAGVAAAVAGAPGALRAVVGALAPEAPRALLASVTATLAAIAVVPGHDAPLHRAGAVPALTRLLCAVVPPPPPRAAAATAPAEDAAIARQAAAALWSLAAEHDAAAAIVEGGGLRPLIDMLQVRAWRYAFPYVRRMAICIPVCAPHGDMHSRMCAAWWRAFPCAVLCASERTRTRGAAGGRVRWRRRRRWGNA